MNQTWQVFGKLPGFLRVESNPAGANAPVVSICKSRNIKGSVVKKLKYFKITATKTPFVTLNEAEVQIN
jgi:hypothetical protein